MPKKQTFTSEFERMKVGDTKGYPASRYTSVRSLASTMSFMLNRKYSTCIDRERRIVTLHVFNNPLIHFNLGMKIWSKNMLFVGFETWQITVLSLETGEELKPCFGDYVKYIYVYLFRGIPDNYSPSNRRFISRLYNVLKRLATRSLKPTQFGTDV